MAYHPFHHLGLKFLAVIVAFGLWFAVAGEQTVERTLRAPLELQGRPDQFELVENAPLQVDVRVRGAAGILSQLGQGEVVAVLDLSSAREGRKYFYLAPSHVRAPYGVEVVEVRPGTISLMFERSGTRMLPVTAVVEGEPAPGYVADAYTVEPSHVEVRGPGSALQRVKDAVTEPVSIQGAKQTVRQAVTINVPDASLRLTSQSGATVTVPVRLSPIERTVRQVPVRVRNAGRGLSAQAVPAVVTAVAKGPRDVVEALQPDSIVAFVDLAGMIPGQYNLSVKVEPPQGFVVVKTDPATVRVRIR
jgi:hypothetical protein